MKHPAILWRTLRAAMHWLAGASVLLAGTALQAEDCFPHAKAPPQHSNNRPITPAAPAALAQGDWPTPVASELRARFPCSRLWGRCSLDEVLQRAHVCALLVIQKGRLVHEYYESANENCSDGTDPVANGPAKQYGLASVAKSVTATLLGQVLSDPARYGPVTLDDPVSRFVDGLPQGSAMHQVTLRQALTMTSALRYDDDANCLKRWTVDHPPEVSRTLVDAVAAYRDRDPAATPGHTFHYAGLDSALLGLVLEGVLARQPAGGPRHLNQALEAWFWKPAGMRSEARWKGDKADTPIAYCCLYMTARDLGRFGTTLLAHWKRAQAPGATAFDRWVADAGTTRLWPDRRACYIEQRRIRIGYGYQWWTLSEPEGFTAIGVGGQFLHILPQRDTVIVQFGSWPAVNARDWPDAVECDVYAAHRFLADRDWP